VRIVALDAEGSPDPSFGEGGIQTIPTGPVGPWWCYGGAVGDVAVATDGDIVIAAIHVADCPAMFPAQRAAAVIRIRSDGSRETTFARDGVGSYPVWSVDECCYITPIDLLVGERGQLSWVGSVQRARDGYEEWQQNLMVVRVDRTGGLVTTYGDQGIARLTGWDVSAAATSASALDGGAVIVAGRGGLGWDQYYGPRLVVRFGPRGRPDPTFSSDGVWLGGYRDDPGEPVGTWVDRAGRVTAAWSTGDYFGDRTALTLCRILPTGTLDRTFGSGGCLRIRLASAWWSQGPEPAPGRKLVVAGYGGPTSEESTSIEAVRLLTT
jgi:hypothetical protein